MRAVGSNDSEQFVKPPVPFEQRIVGAVRSVRGFFAVIVDDGCKVNSSEKDRVTHTWALVRRSLFALLVL